MPFLSIIEPIFELPWWLWASLVAQRVKRLPAMWDTWVRSLGREDPLEKEVATHSSILAWRIPWTEEPGRLESTGSQRVRYDWATSLSLCLKCSLGISNFLEEISGLSHSIVFLPCTDHCGRLSYLSLLFIGTLHSNGYIFPFLLCLLLLFLSQLFVRPPQTAILLFCISFSWGWSFLGDATCLLYNVMSLRP